MAKTVHRLMEQRNPDTFYANRADCNGARVEPTQLTSNLAEVTCKRCLKRAAKGA